jgi:polyisoprenoid-binding protein YceI
MSKIAACLTLPAALACLATGSLAAGVSGSDPSVVPAGTYLLDPSHTSTAARVVHFGFSKTTVMFDKVEGSFSYDPAKPEASKLNVTIDTASLSSGFALRDTHLKGDKWFNVAAHPTISFASSQLTRTGPATADLAGNLTIMGISKPVLLKVKFNGVGESMTKKTTVGFEATTSLKRSDFGMTAFAPAIGDTVDILIDVEATRQ